MSRLEQHYSEKVKESLFEKFKFKSAMEIPRIKKITLNVGLGEAVGDKKGIKRYGHSYVPLDEALSRVVLDLSGRPGLHMKVDFVKEEVGGIDVNMFEHFFQSLCNHAFLTLHIENFSGENTHHQIETIFKAFGRALRMALEIDSKQEDVIPSTKGAL